MTKMNNMLERLWRSTHRRRWMLFLGLILLLALIGKVLIAWRDYRFREYQKLEIRPMPIFDRTNR